jgi:hypothetical protein
MSARSVSLSVAAVLLSIQVTSLIAQGKGSQSHGSDIGIAVRAGTIGIGGEVSKLLTSHVGARVGLNFYTLNDNGQSIGDNTFDVKAELHAFSALIDLYPGSRGSFHLTGGLMTTPAKITGVGSGSSYTFNGTSYTASQVGTLTVAAAYGSTLPYVGLGFGTAASSHGGLAFVFDLGFAIGKPALTMSGSNAPSGGAVDANIQAEVAKHQTDINKIPGFPVLAIGFMYRF